MDRRVASYTDINIMLKNYTFNFLQNSVLFLYNNFVKNIILL
jgi:virulence-associated protein VapD